MVWTYRPGPIPNKIPFNWFGNAEFDQHSEALLPVHKLPATNNRWAHHQAVPHPVLAAQLPELLLQGAADHWEVCHWVSGVGNYIGLTKMKNKDKT